VSLGSFQHWGINFMNTKQQQYEMFYQMINKYYELFACQLPEQQQKLSALDMSSSSPPATGAKKSGMSLQLILC
jgi:hypothetical protein